MRTALRSRQAGLSLVEVMVAVLIGLIGILIITQAYITGDRFNRSTHCIADAINQRRLGGLRLRRLHRGSGGDALVFGHEGIERLARVEAGQAIERPLLLE